MNWLLTTEFTVSPAEGLSKEHVVQNSLISSVCPGHFKCLSRTRLKFCSIRSLPFSFAGCRPASCQIPSACFHPGISHCRCWSASCSPRCSISQAVPKRCWAKPGDAEFPCGFLSTTAGRELTGNPRTDTWSVWGEHHQMVRAAVLFLNEMEYRGLMRTQGLHYPI